MEQADKLHQRAVTAVGANDYTGALELLESARALTSDPDLLDRIDITASLAIAHTVDSAAGIALCEKVLARSRVPVTVGLTHSQLGMLHMVNADSTAAFASFDRAREALAGHSLHLAKLHLNRGMVHLQQGDPGLAAEDFAVAAEHFARSSDPMGRAMAVFNLGYTHLLRNDFVAAMRGMDEAAETLAELSPVNRAIVQQDRAEVLVASGRTREATEALEAASAAYGSQRLRRMQAECEYILARTLLTEDPARARTVARAAARRFRAHGSDPWALRADSIALVAEIESGASTRALVPACDVVVAGLRQAGHRLDADRLALHAARLVVRCGDFADAAARVNRVRTTRDSPITTQLLTREVRAELAEARGQSARLRSHARRGLAALHTWQATFGSLDLQSSSVGHGRHLARLGLRAAMTDGAPEVVLEWSERARALASRVTSLRPPPDPALAADLTALRIADPRDRGRVRELKERIRAHTWLAAEGTVGEPVTLGLLTERLARDDAALVAHIVLDGEVTALAITGKEAAIVPLGEAGSIRSLLDRVAADLDFAAQNRTGDIAEAVRRSLRADLGLLAERLVRPVLATVGYRRLVLTPSALLAGTPWTCLPGLIGRPLTVPTSASRWCEQTDGPAPGIAAAGFVAGPGLARAAEEVRRSATAWPDSQVLLGKAADAEHVGRLASRVDLFHVAGHGRHPGDHPLFSAIELVDGPWFGHDIDLLPRAPEVVVLSACDLGRQTVLHGEESVGMSAAWLYAGARAVISSPALLADEVACDVLSGWHRRVAAGSPPADALAQVTAEAEEIVPLLTFGAGW